MAWDNKREKSTIFDGPMATTEERDTCGVGFIDSTNSEVKYTTRYSLSYLLYLYLMLYAITLSRSSLKLQIHQLIH